MSAAAAAAAIAMGHGVEDHVGAAGVQRGPLARDAGAISFAGAFAPPASTLASMRSQSISGTDDSEASRVSAASAFSQALSESRDVISPLRWFCPFRRAPRFQR